MPGWLKGTLNSAQLPLAKSTFTTRRALAAWVDRHETTRVSVLGWLVPFTAQCTFEYVYGDVLVDYRPCHSSDEQILDV